MLKEKILKETLFCLFNTKGLVVDSVDKMSMAINSQGIIEIKIKNKTNWVLTGASFKAQFRPSGRIMLQEIDPPQLQAFEGELKLKIKFKSADKTGKCRLNVKMLFEDPIILVTGAPRSLKIVYKESILIKNIDIDIQ